jgi:hypothetical protein
MSKDARPAARHEVILTAMNDEAALGDIPSE